jgi:hypothetical protein
MTEKRSEAQSTYLVAILVLLESKVNVDEKSTTDC